LGDAVQAKGRRHCPRQAILRYLLQENGAVEVSWLYADSGGSLVDLHALADQGLVILSEAQIWRDPLAGLEFTPTQSLPLIPDQQAAWEEIKAAYANRVNCCRSSAPWGNWLWQEERSACRS
jgi:hypothetical protein